MTTKRDLERRLKELEAQNLELLARAGELPEMPRNREGLPFSGPRLILVRNVRGLTVSEMAKEMHCDKRIYIGYESEIVAPTVEQIGNMSMILHWPLKFFFCEGFRLIDLDASGWSGPPIVLDADELHVRKWYA